MCGTLKSLNMLRYKYMQTNIFLLVHVSLTSCINYLSPIFSAVVDRYYYRSSDYFL